MRNKGRAAALSLAVLACACRQAPPPAASEAPVPPLDAPAPSSGVVASPLAGEATSYTNEMQAQNLREQAAELGISGLSKPSLGAGDESNAPPRTITYQEGIERTRAMAREAAEERRALEGDKNRSIAIPSPTPGMISGAKEGAPIEGAADSGPEKPAQE